MLESFNESDKKEAGKDSSEKAKENESIKTNENQELEDIRQAVQEETKSVTNEVPKASKEKFYRVKFQAKSHPNDTEDVPLGVNGEVLNIQREVEVIIPGRFKEVADNAKFPHFTQAPGEKRKITSWVKSYPFEVIGEATEQEYLEMKREGDRKTREALPV